MWEQIRANKRKAVWLIILMGLILLVMGYVVGEVIGSGLGPFGMFIGLVILFLQLLMYAFAGESILMAGLGAREMTRDESPRLFNIVEEMQIASGLGYMPRIFLVDTDLPNAFAVGRKPQSSIVAVTRGLMYRLNRDELQGVIAHEIAHLKNLDTKFMTLAGVMLGTIVVMSDFAMRMLFYGGRGQRRSNSRGGNNDNVDPRVYLAMLALALLLIILGPVLARLLYFALSRTREYLADASSAVYTRYPDGLASALIKISGSAGQPGTSIGDANRAVAPMFIVNPLSASGSDSMFATHPPVHDRVAILRGMGGASFVDYDNAFRSVKRGSHVIGKHTLAESDRQAIRPAFADDEPLNTRDETKAIVHAMYGYATIDCECGARLKIPSTYNEPEVRCIRCGRVHAAPDFPSGEELSRTSDAQRRQNILQTRNNPPAILDYTRKAKGVWEGFPCQCGATIQLSPLFSAPTMLCRKCGTQWRIH